MPDPQPQPQQTTDQVVVACATAIGRNVLGRDLTPEEAEAMKTIFSAAAQALSEGSSSVWPITFWPSAGRSPSRNSSRTS